MITPRQSQIILKWCIESAIGLIFDLCERAGEKLGVGELNEYFRQNLNDPTVSSRKISRITYELKRHNYIEIGEGDSVRLTNKAKIKIIDRYSDLNKSDGKRRLVSFDIPEIKRRQRNGFRRTIKKLGFRQIQKSLWVSNNNVGDMVEIAAKEFDVDEYVAYFVVESSNIENHISTILSKDSDN